MGRSCRVPMMTTASRSCSLRKPRTGWFFEIRVDSRLGQSGQATMEEESEQSNHVASTFAGRVLKARKLMDEPKKRCWPLARLPRAHWRQTSEPAACTERREVPMLGSVGTMVSARR
jgi:hypothetical protein